MTTYKEITKTEALKLLAESGKPIEGLYFTDLGDTQDPTLCSLVGVDLVKWCGFSTTAKNGVYISWHRCLQQIITPDIAKGNNRKKLTEDEVGVKDGWRLLTVEECVKRNEVFKSDKDIQMFEFEKWSDDHGAGFYGNSLYECYRTKKPEGYFLDDIVEYVPFTFETMPKSGTLITWPNEGKRIYVVTGYLSDTIILGHSTHVAYADLLLKKVEYSIDGGKTWALCGTKL